MDAESYKKSRIRINDYTWDAEVCGGVIALKARRKFPTPNKPALRGTITHFTRRSRFRMFKLVAKINWCSVGSGRFVTLTFPDEVLPMHSYMRMRALAEFLRKLERAVGYRVSALWRCEWKVRLSGRYRGKVAPHYHLIIFDIGCFSYKHAWVWWQQALRSPVKADIDVKHLGTKKHHAVYIAKYAAKEVDLLSLDNVSYSRIDGRHWGVYRRRLLPLAKQWYFEDIKPESLKSLRTLASQTLTWWDKDCDAGFVIMGKFGVKLAMATLEMLLTREAPGS